MNQPNLPLQFITDNESLMNWCQQAQNNTLLAIDTEFMRVNTYYPDLCLIQVATQTEWVLIDPKTITDFKPLQSLLENRSCLKIMHSGAQDLETLYHHLNVLPQPIFDTQVAYNLVHPEYKSDISYQDLVQEMEGLRLDKDQTRTNWALRPLSEAQIQYAIDDVRYLIPIFLAQHELLERQSLISQMNQQMTDLLKADKYHVDFDEIWRKVKHKNKLRGKKLTMLRYLAGLREKIAIQQNKPRQWIISDETLLKLCLYSDNVHKENFSVSLSHSRDQKHLDLFIDMLREFIPKEKEISNDSVNEQDS